MTLVWLAIWPPTAPTFKQFRASSSTCLLKAKYFFSAASKNLPTGVTRTPETMNSVHTYLEVLFLEFFSTPRRRHEDYNTKCVKMI